MINKDKINLQLTLNKEDLKRLEEITKALKDRFKIDLSKSQTIQFLINKFKLENENLKPIIKIPNYKTPKPIFKDSNNKEIKPYNLQDQREESKRKLNLLKTKLNITSRELCDRLSINYETFKSYTQGKRLPTGENAEKILKMYEKYGII